MKILKKEDKKKEDEEEEKEEEIPADSDSISGIVTRRFWDSSLDISTGKYKAE